MSSRLVELLAALIVLSPAHVGVAAQTYTIPFTVVPGSVRIQPDTAAVLPFSVAVSAPTCRGTGTLSAQLVNGGIEVEFAGSAFEYSSPPETFSCPFTTGVRMTVELQVPEFAGTATMVRLEGVPLGSSFSSIGQASASAYADGALGSSSSIPGYFDAGQFRFGFFWNQTGVPQVLSFPTELNPWVPGDTVRIPVAVTMTFTGDPGRPTQGTARVRWVFKVTVPEPNASLSLPIGMLGVASLASLRAPSR